MDQAEEVARINYLVNTILKCRAGYSKGTPELSDGEYDNLENELRELSPKHPLLEEVGYEASGEKVQHVVPMLSLDKCYEVAEFNAWVKRTHGSDTEVLLGMPKYDGCAVELRYRGGGDILEFYQAVTRGDGLAGEDVTGNVMQVRNIPMKITAPGRNSGVIRVRGEIMMFRKTFDKINADLPEDKKYKSPRNLASGTLGCDDPQVVWERELYFIAYNSNHNASTLSIRFENLKGLGFTVPQCIKLKRDGALAAWEKLSKNRVKLAYDIDGMVFAIDDVGMLENAGTTSHHPKGMIAWKFEADTACTILTEVVWQVSRNGILFPVGIFDPVELDGATITRATLYNVSEIERLCIGIGSQIRVARRGGVIPKILGGVVSVFPSTIRIPDRCPMCLGETKVIEGANGIKVLYCTNLDCPAKLVSKILHYIDCMEIDGVGVALVEKLLAAGLIKSIPDLYALTATTLMQLDGIQHRMAQKIVESIHKNTSHASFPNFLHAIGVPNVGKSLAKTLAAKFPSLFDIMTATKDDLKVIDGIDIKTAANIVKFFAKKATILLMVKLVDFDHSELFYLMELVDFDTGEIPYLTFDYAASAPKEPVGGVFSGKKFVLTGTLPSGKAKCGEIIENNGGIVSSSVSKTTDYVVVGDKPGSKLEKAQKLGILTISENDMLRMLNDAVETPENEPTPEAKAVSKVHQAAPQPSQKASSIDDYLNKIRDAGGYDSFVKTYENNKALVEHVLAVFPETRDDDATANNPMCLQNVCDRIRKQMGLKPVTSESYRRARQDIQYRRDPETKILLEIRYPSLNLDILFDRLKRDGYFRSYFSGKASGAIEGIDTKNMSALLELAKKRMTEKEKAIKFDKTKPVVFDGDDPADMLANL